jgi:NADH-quinone oxidoreductase subunit L
MSRLMSLTFFGEHRSPLPRGEHGTQVPRESSAVMTVSLMTLAVGAMVAGFFNVPPVLGGSAALEHFLEPSLTAAATWVPASAGEPHLSRLAELGLMALSVIVATIGLLAAYRFYVTRPETAEHFRERFAAVHTVLLNKYYVDEFYDSTFVRGTRWMSSGLWAFDRRVVDGAVNAWSWMTVLLAWLSGLIDKHVVDGAVNRIGRSAEESSFLLRRLQTGLIQNYALLMLAGVAVFVSIYLLVR